MKEVPIVKHTRKWLRVLSAAVASVVLLAGCQSASTQSTAAGSGAAEQQVLTGTGQGIEGDVVVEVTTDGQKIYSIDVVERTRPRASARWQWKSSPA